MRHGETEWSRDGRHTGRTDVPLTDEGRRQAGRLRDALGEWTFTRVLSSPLSRALDTCRLAGLGDRAWITGTVRSWMKSPPHRSLLLSPNFRWVGAGTAQGALSGQDVTVGKEDHVRLGRLQL